MYRLIILLIATAIVAGCTSRVTDFTIISTKNFDLSRASEFQRADVRAEGVDTKHIIVFIPTGVPNAKEAIDRAIEQVPGGVALLDGVLSVHHFYIPFLYGQSSYIVRGTVLIDPALVRADQLDDDTMILALDEQGSMLDTRHLTEAEIAELKELAQNAI